MCSIECKNVVFGFWGTLKIIANFRIGPCEFAEVLRAEIFEATKCTASVGLGPSLLLARLATRKAKPNGVFLLTKDEAQEYMQTVSVQDLPGEFSPITVLFSLLVNVLLHC